MTVGTARCAVTARVERAERAPYRSNYAGCAARAVSLPISGVSEF